MDIPFSCASPSHDGFLPRPINSVVVAASGIGLANLALLTSQHCPLKSYLLPQGLSATEHWRQFTSIASRDRCKLVIAVASDAEPTRVQVLHDLARLALDGGVETLVVLCGRNEGVSRPFRRLALSRSPLALPAYRLISSGGDVEFRLNLAAWLGASEALQNPGALAFVDARVTLDFDGLMMQIATVLRDNCEMLEYLSAQTNGPLATVNMVALMSRDKSSDDVEHVEALIDVVAPRATGMASRRVLSDQQQRRFNSPAKRKHVFVRLKRAPVKQRILSSLTPLVFNQNGTIDSVLIQTHRTVHRTTQNADILIGTDMLSPQEERELCARIKALPLGAVPEFLFVRGRRNWGSLPPSNDHEPFDPASDGADAA